MMDRELGDGSNVPAYSTKQEIKHWLNNTRSECLPTRIKWDEYTYNIGGTKLNWPTQFKLISSN